MKQIEFDWTSKNDLKVYAKEWAIDNPKAVVCIVHGAGEHCNRYNHVASFFNQNSLAVVAYDRNGNGRSEGARGRTHSYESFLEDVDQLLAQAKSRYPNLPIILYAHSMGGNITLQYLIQRNPQIKGAIVTGPWMKLVKNPSPILIFIGRIMNKITGGFTQPNGLDPNHVSRDKAVVKAYIDDPLVHDKMGSKAGIYTYEKGLELFNYTGKINIPLLIMHGEQDQIIDVEGSRRFAKNVSGDISYKEWEGLYHEIHNDPEKEEVLAYAMNWIKNL